MKYLLFMLLLMTVLITAGCTSENKNIVVTPSQTTIIPPVQTEIKYLDYENANLGYKIKYPEIYTYTTKEIPPEEKILGFYGYPFSTVFSNRGGRSQVIVEVVDLRGTSISMGSIEDYTNALTKGLLRRDGLSGSQIVKNERVISWEYPTQKLEYSYVQTDEGVRIYSTGYITIIGQRRFNIFCYSTEEQRDNTQDIFNKMMNSFVITLDDKNQVIFPAPITGISTIPTATPIPTASSTHETTWNGNLATVNQFYYADCTHTLDTTNMEKLSGFFMTCPDGTTVPFVPRPGTTKASFINHYI